MAYSVYLIEPFDKDNWIELDTEAVDFSTIFSVADVSDISSRKDKMTKLIAFKGSPTNHQAFGSLFHLNRATDFDLSNKLFFNYNPLRTVDCLIFEDGALLLKGSLRVLEISSDKNGNVVYQTQVTGSLIDFKQIVSERTLEDLDFSDLQHRFNWSNIQDSWEARTERYNTSTSAYTFKPFAKGSGYVYPFIDYGYTYNQTTANTDVNNIPVSNFRPAVYAKEYVDRIFLQPELTGYTYEIGGDQNLKDRFNSLIIPSNLEKMVTRVQGKRTINLQAGIATQNANLQIYTDTDLTRAIQLKQTFNELGLMNWYGLIKGQHECTFFCNRTFTSNGFCRVVINTFHNPWPVPVKVNLQLCQRGFLDSANPDFQVPSNWEVVASKSLTVPAEGSLPPYSPIEFEVGERTYTATTLLMLRIQLDGIPYRFELFPGSPFTRFSFSEGQMRFPKDELATVQYEVVDGDAITPKPAEGVKQMDFLKSLMHLFNFYVYSTNERPKHLIFQRYDDFYGLAAPQHLATTALDWTNKIDYTSGLKIQSNVRIPKKYLFTFKDDGDNINSDYKNKYGEPYGTFRFNDSYGLGDERKVETVFSPSPLISVVGTGRVYPAIYKLNGSNKQPTKSNIRVMYYNGAKSTRPYQVGKNATSNGVHSVTSVASNVTRYPQCGNYYLDSGLNTMKPLDDLYFGPAKFMYFDFTNDHQTASTAYQMHYQGQVTDITKPDTVLVECQAYLNEVDIANLDLRIPIYLDMGPNGHAYFKVLNCEYFDNLTPARLSLQKIDV